MAAQKSIGIEYLRVICMFLVIINHLVAQFGFMSDVPYSFRAFWTINTPLISVGMPMFFFISGILVFRQVKMGKQMRFTAFVYNKSRRLMIPYFVFSLLIMLIYGFFDYKAFVYFDFWHLWFLPTLLWFMCLAPVYLKFSGSRSYKDLVLFVVSLSIPFIPLPRYLAIDSAAFWLFTFLGGVLFEKYRPSNVKLFCWIISFTLSLIVYLLVWRYVPCEYRSEPSLLYMLSVLALMSTSCGLFEAVFLSTNKTLLTQTILYISSLSFAIYNIHYIIVGMTVRRPILMLFQMTGIDYTTPFVLIISQCILVFVVSMVLCIFYRFAVNKCKAYKEI